MKNYNIYVSLLMICLIGFASCSKEDLGSSVDKEFVFIHAPQTDLFFESLAPGEQSDIDVRVVRHAQDSSLSISYTFEILSSSTAVEGVHYVVDANSGSIAAGDVSSQLPIKVIPSNLVACQALNLDLKLSSSDIEQTDGSVVSLSLNLESSSNLAGTVNYVHSDNFAGEELTGSVEIIATQVPGDYLISDFSFGAWPAAYGIDPPSGTLKWTNICSSIKLTGTDNYGDVWQMDEILVSNGPEFKFTWSNTYGEFGTVSLTRNDGKLWPEFQLE